MNRSIGKDAALRAPSYSSTRAARVLVLYYSSYGHIVTMANAVAEGARQTGAQVALRRVPELVPEDVARQSGYYIDTTPVATIAELPQYDAIIFGTPTRFGNMASQMKNFLDQTGGLWAEDALVGKLASVFTCSGSQHGGQESTLLSAHIVLMHLGMVIVGLPYTFKGQMRMDEITGCSPYGASTLAGEGDRQPSLNELDGARFQGKYVAELARTMLLGRERLAAAS